LYHFRRFLATKTLGTGSEATRGIHRRPALQYPYNAIVIVRITISTICGSDLHILKRDVPTVTEGRIPGHEDIGSD
jgi:threonine dehydrogenase-like Zn-dependent dehydrogenase